MFPGGETMMLVWTKPPWSPTEVRSGPPGTLQKSRGTVSSSPFTMNFQVESVRPELRFVVQKRPLPEPTKTRLGSKGSISMVPAQWIAALEIYGKPLGFMVNLLLAIRSFQVAPELVLTRIRSP